MVYCACLGNIYCSSSFQYSMSLMSWLPLLVTCLAELTFLSMIWILASQGIVLFLTEYSTYLLLSHNILLIWIFYIAMVFVPVHAAPCDDYESLAFIERQGEARLLKILLKSSIRCIIQTRQCLGPYPRILDVAMAVTMWLESHCIQMYGWGLGSPNVSGCGWRDWDPRVSEWSRGFHSTPLSCPGIGWISYLDDAARHDCCPRWLCRHDCCLAGG